MKVLVTGAGGQLGQALASTSPADMSLRALSRQEVDISDPKALGRVLDEFSPDLLINAAAYTAVDLAESEPVAAYAANAEGPRSLARACEDRNLRLIHVSTDFVFDGQSHHPYTVDAAPAPLGVYGQSKLAGEQAVTESAARSLIFRTGWVYGAQGHNFVRTMLRLHAERDAISVIADQVGTPTRTESLAGAIWAAARRPGLSGMYHWSDAGVCSWYDFAVAIGEEAVACGLLVKTAAVTPIATEDYPTPAQRPAYSVLDKSRAWRDLEMQSRHWRVELRETLHQIKEQEDGR